MKINLLHLDEDAHDASTSIIYPILNEIFEEYHVYSDDARDFLLCSARGNEVIAQYLFEKYDIQTTTWDWVWDDNDNISQDRFVIARGITLLESPSLTKFLLSVKDNI